MFKKKDAVVKRKSYMTDQEALLESQGSRIVSRHVIYAMGSGLIPMPGVDVGINTFVQLKMLASLSAHYDIKFTRNMGKSFIATLVGYITANTLRNSIFTSMMKMIPYIGGIAAVSMSIYNGAVTYAIGKIFQQHFEAGGTFLTFRPDKVKKHFYRLYEEGREVAANIKEEEQKKKENKKK